MALAQNVGTRGGRRVIQFAGAALALSAVTFLGAAQDGGGAPPDATTQPLQTGDPPSLPDSLRNPRALRNEQNITQGPRMVAGGMPIASETFIDHYVQLEPIVGEFNFTGLQWARQDSEPAEFSGTWTNRWILDGLYLESAFTLNDRSGTPYEVLGLTWYDDNEHQFRGQFLNSANQSQTLRWGTFDDANVINPAAPDGASANDLSTSGASAASAAEQESPAYPTLTMLGRSANQPADSEPSSKFELVIVSVNEFRYVGYNRPRDGEGDWRKSFEMTMTRIEPIEVEAGPSN